MFKRLLLALGAVLLLLVLVVAVIGYRTFGVTTSMEGPSTHGRVWTVPTGFVQSAIVDVGNGGVVLIDAGMDSGAKELLAALQQRGLGKDAVQAILLTHGHGDHQGGVAAFPGVPVHAHQDEVPLVEGRHVSRAPSRFLHRGEPVTAKVTHPFRTGQTLRLGEVEVRTFHLPGHTPGSVAYLVDGVLLLGDSAVARKDGTLAGAPWFFSEDTDQNARSLAVLAAELRGEEVQRMVFSHSGSLAGLKPLQEFAARVPGAPAEEARR